MRRILRSWAAALPLLVGVAAAQAGAGALPARAETLPPVGLSKAAAARENPVQGAEEGFLGLATQPESERSTLLMLVAGLGGLVVLGRRRQHA